MLYQPPPCHTHTHAQTNTHTHYPLPILSPSGMTSVLQCFTRARVRQVNVYDLISDGPRCTSAERAHLSECTAPLLRGLIRRAQALVTLSYSMGKEGVEGTRERGDNKSRPRALQHRSYGRSLRSHAAILKRTARISSLMKMISIKRSKMCQLL